MTRGTRSIAQSEGLKGGAFVAKELGDLTESQQKTLRRIVNEVTYIARDSAIERQETQGRSQAGKGGQLGIDTERNEKQAKRRPRQVYLVDGARGAGKTTTLLTLQALIRQIGRSPKQDRDDPIPRLVEDLFDRDKKTTPHPLFESIKVGGAARARPVFVFPTIFPARFNSSEPIIEAVFAEIRDHIEKIAKSREKSGARAEDAEAEKVKLLKQFNEEVAGSWLLSRPDGRDAIQRDSFNVENFLDLRAKFDTRSHRRQQLWRDFVDRFLDYVDGEMLALFFDDTDTDPSENFELLHTIRIFLDHPRIVTLIAGNLKSMRRSLFLYQRAQLAATPALSTARSETETNRFVEEYLEKVLPPPNRYFLTNREFPSHSLPNVSGTEVTESDPDDDSIFHLPFDEYCLRRLSEERMAHLLAKLRTARDPRDHSASDKLPGFADDVVRRGTAYIAEDYTSWWLLRHFYTAALAPRTMRQRAHIQSYMNKRHTGEEKKLVPGAGPDTPRRLPVILFEMSDNARLISLFTDTDNNVLDWLHRQVVSSSWTGDRYFEINGDRFYDGAFEFDFISYRIDLTFAAPIWNNPEEDVPSGLLPSLRLPGADLAGQPLTRALPGHARQRRYGVSRWIDHPIIPSGCIYMFDLTTLNQWVWREAASLRSPNATALWAPSEMHRHWDYEHKWSDAVLDDEPAFFDVHSYWDLNVLDAMREASKSDKAYLVAGGRLSTVKRQDRNRIFDVWRKTEGVAAGSRNGGETDKENNTIDRNALVSLRRTRSVQLAKKQRRTIANYTRRVVVPFAAVSQAVLEDGAPNHKSEAGHVRSWRDLKKTHNDLCPLLATIERGKAIRAEIENRTSEPVGSSASASLNQAWTDLAQAANGGLAEGYSPFAGLLNDLLCAHFAVRIFQGTVAASLKAETSKKDQDRDMFHKHRGVVRCFLRRSEAFSATEPARIITLEDVQTLISHMGQLGVMAPQSLLDLARMARAMEEPPRQLEKAESWGRGLECFIFRALMRPEVRQREGRAYSPPLKTAVEDQRPVVGYDIPIVKGDASKGVVEDIPTGLHSLVEKLCSSNANADTWKTLLEFCGESLVGARDKTLVLKDPTQAGYWMWPEFEEFAYRARAARAFLLFLYSFVPVMRSLYELDREAFLIDFEGIAPANADRLTPWRESGRPFMWAETAAKMRNFVRRFGDVLRLARMRLELRAMAYGDGAKGGRQGNADLANAIEVLLKNKGRKSDEFMKTGGVKFIHMPDFSHLTLGVSLGSESRGDGDGILQKTFEAAGDFFELIYTDVPTEHWPEMPPKKPKAGQRRVAQAQAAGRRPAAKGTRKTKAKKRRA